MKILIIEDSKVEARILGQTLQRIMDDPVSVRHTSTLQDGLSVLMSEQDDIDLVFLDLKLSDSTEWEDTYDTIVPYTRKIPVIVMSANDDKDVARDILRRGAEDYIVKGGKKRSTDMLKESIEFALCRHDLLKKLSSRVTQDDQQMHWVTGGYSVE